MSTRVSGDGPGRTADLPACRLSIPSVSRIANPKRSADHLKIVYGLRSQNGTRIRTPDYESIASPPPAKVARNSAARWVA